MREERTEREALSITRRGSRKKPSLSLFVLPREEGCSREKGVCLVYCKTLENTKSIQIEAGRRSLERPRLTLLPCEVVGKGGKRASRHQETARGATKGVGRKEERDQRGREIEKILFLRLIITVI